MFSRSLAFVLLLATGALSGYVPVHPKPCKLPLVVTLWDNTDVTRAAWDELLLNNGTAVTSAVIGCESCELSPLCPGAGGGESPDELGEVSLDATVADGSTLRVGSIGSLQHVRRATRTAYFVLTQTSHSSIVGTGAYIFAREMGLSLLSTNSPESIQDYLDWKDNQCQPNYWQNVDPDSSLSCGPYRRLYDVSDLAPSRPAPNPFVFTPHSAAVTPNYVDQSSGSSKGDSAAVISIDSSGNIAAAASSNGKAHRVQGRQSDCSFPGSSAYASNDLGAAITTGSGDVIGIFTPASFAVALLDLGFTPQEAAHRVIARINKWYPNVPAGIVVVNVYGEIGAACSGQDEITYNLLNEEICHGNINIHRVKCTPY